ncbi:MAG: 16S rRNA (guanine1516-N2)-methyltransferase [Desulforhopalus sp.]|jgi:16S rRNA (guanine1516-N2)-methyltransferase
MPKSTNYLLNTSVSSTIKSTTFLQKAENLSIKINLPYCQSPAASKTEFILCYTEKGLELLSYDTVKNKTSSLLFVDFVHGKEGHRRINNATTKQPLAKAVGIKPGIRPTVFDATAGLGGDAFVLATLGCRVTLCERNPVMAALLGDGLDRALASTETNNIVQNYLHLVKASSLSPQKPLSQDYDTVYLDPMYPHDTKSALNKMSMRVIRSLVGDDNDSWQLMDSAKLMAKKRIVIKRPRRAPPLTDDKISYQVKMKSSRFDVYIT